VAGKRKESILENVLGTTVDEKYNFFANEKPIADALYVLRQVGLGYLRMGQAATELSGGEAQRIKLATEFQRAQQGNVLHILNEPTTGLHPADVEKLMVQLKGLVDAGNTVIVVEHSLDVILQSDWVIDIGAGNSRGTVVAEGTPEQIAKSPKSRTAPYLRSHLKD
jgi:excinuclease ABC subunit A